MSTEQKHDIQDIVRDSMDKMYAEGFEMGKLRVASYLQERVEWLKREAHGGGDFRHLITRADECAYIASVIAEMTPPPL